MSNALQSIGWKHVEMVYMEIIFYACRVMFEEQMSNCTS